MTRTFYYIVKTSPPTLEDFRSYVEQGVPVLSHDPEVLRMAQGISAWATRNQAERIGRLRPHYGQYTVELAIPDGSSVTFERTGRQRGHHTIYGTLEERFRCVVPGSVAPILPVDK